MASKKHIVRDGDTLSSIAAQYHTSQDVLKSLNNLTDDTLYTGAELSLPDAQSPQSTLENFTVRRNYTTPDLSGVSSAAEALRRIETAMPGYTASDALKKAEELLSQWERNKPGDYTSSYEKKIAEILGQLENRPGFSYDPAGDALYGIYRDQYERQGRMAMLESQANAAALSGGYANSYAVTAGSQAYQNYLSQLSGILPELYDRAYSRWKDEGEALAEQLSRYRDLDQSDYERWRGDVSDYYEDLTYYFNRYSDMSSAEYKAYQDDLAAWQNDRDYWYKKAQAEQEQANWQAQFALSQQKASSSRSGGGSSSRRSSSSSSSKTVSSRYNTFWNGLRESVRIETARGKSKSYIYRQISNQVNEFVGNGFITAAEGKQMRAAAQSYYATQARRR